MKEKRGEEKKRKKRDRRERLLIGKKLRGK